MDNEAKALAQAFLNSGGRSEQFTYYVTKNNNNERTGEVVIITVGRVDGVYQKSVEHSLTESFHTASAYGIDCPRCEGTGKISS